MTLGHTILTRRRLVKVLSLGAVLFPHKGWAASASAIAERVTRIIVKHLEVKESQVTPTARLRNDLGADSLDIVELVMALEEEFKIKIPVPSGMRLEFGVAHSPVT